LWEAGIRSFKQHLRRIVGTTSLNFEEFYTVLSQIEACLNPRPTTVLSSDPNDLQPLTPGHFLIGRPLNSIPEPNLLEVKPNLLMRWQLVQRLVQPFWMRWSSEYLSRLQQRSKWWAARTNIQVVDVVLVKDEHLPPMRWK
jgi:hypothetical protein